MERFDDGSMTLPIAVFGVLLVVVMWAGVWWNVGAAHGLLPLSVLPWGDVLGLAVAVVLPTVGVLGAAALLLQALRCQRRVVDDLRLKEIELDENRARLRRYVADFERIADIADHDLQEPLRRVVAYSQLLAEHGGGSADDEVKSYVSHLVDGAWRMKAMVGGLRAFVAVDSLPVGFEKTSATAALTIARKRVGEALTSAGVALVVDPLPEVAADQASLVEIFAQLIDNGVRYRAQSRRPVIHVSASRENGMVAFRVSDNGVGIEAAGVARMFEIFHRPQGAETRQGIGMGLAVVRRLVERLGGSVWVESEKGNGSTFGFTLPAEPAAEMIASHSEQEAQAA